MKKLNNDSKRFPRAYKIRASVFDLSALVHTIEEREAKTLQSDFWQDQKAAQALFSELNELKERVAIWENVAQEIHAEKEKLDLLVEWEKELGNEEPEKIHELVSEIEKKLGELERLLQKHETQAFLAGPHDHLSATLSVASGAGGTDAADWAAMVLRMYTYYAQNKNWKIKLLHEHTTQEGGIKSATVEIAGKYAYGFLKFENGVHRLVRISPFDANKRRHTSFASVEVLPVLTEDLSKKIVIKSEDIEVMTSRSSGPGGQNVNRRETAVRIVHMPTGLAVECQSERTQGDNKRRAMELLTAKLAAREEQAKRDEMLHLRGEKVSTSWGNQIRSYVLHPYQMVKDHRTGVEEHDIENVLNGSLDSFIEAEIQQFGGK